MISPLLSLIQDQVSGLIKNDVPCAYYTSSAPALIKKQIHRDLQLCNKGQEPTIKLLYVTPEGIINSHALYGDLDDLEAEVSFKNTRILHWYYLGVVL